MQEKDLIEQIKEMAFKGMDYEAILKVVEKRKDQISVQSFELAKTRIDDFIISYQLGSQEKSKAFNQILIGVVLLLFGVGITGFTYYNGNSHYVLAYGAILSGAWIIKVGYKEYQKPIEELTPRKSVFRKKY